MPAAFWGQKIRLVRCIHTIVNGTQGSAPSIEDRNSWSFMRSTSTPDAICVVSRLDNRTCQPIRDYFETFYTPGLAITDAGARIVGKPASSACLLGPNQNEARQ